MQGPHRFELANDDAGGSQKSQQPFEDTQESSWYIRSAEPWKAIRGPRLRANGLILTYRVQVLTWRFLTLSNGWYVNRGQGDARATC